MPLGGMRGGRRSPPPTSWVILAHTLPRAALPSPTMVLPGRCVSRWFLVTAGGGRRGEGKQRPYRRTAVTKDGCACRSTLYAHLWTSTALDVEQGQAISTHRAFCRRRLVGSLSSSQTKLSRFAPRRSGATRRLPFRRWAWWATFCLLFLLPAVSVPPCLDLCRAHQRAAIRCLAGMAGHCLATHHGTHT